MLWSGLEPRTYFTHSPFGSVCRRFASTRSGRCEFCVSMAHSKRIPAFPLSQGDALLAETAGRLGTDEVLTPETLDALFSSMASVRREIHANPEPGFEEY